MKFERYETRFQAGEILEDLIQEKDKTLYNLILENPLAKPFCHKSLSVIPEDMAKYSAPLLQRFGIKE